MGAGRHSSSVSIKRRTGACFALLATASIAACNGTPGTLPATPLRMQRPAATGTKIEHVIIVIQENRSFDNFFATYPGADGATQGQAAAVPASDDCVYPLTKSTTVPLTEVNLEGQGFPASYGYQVPTDLNHLHVGFQADWDHGKMDGFDLEGLGAAGTDGPACTYPYQYVNPKDIAPYWRPHVSDSRQRQFYRTSRSDCRRHRSFR
jgi:phospholipase C